MKDFKQIIEAIEQRASGSIEVLDYTGLIGANATGTVAVVDYAELIGTAATGTITIVDYTALAGAVVTFNGNTYTEGVDFTAATSNEATATSLTSAIDAGEANFSAAAVGAVITVDADTVGVAGNVAMSSDAGVNITFSAATLEGGTDHSTLTVDGNALVQGTDFTAETSNDVTATNLAAAIDLIAGYSAAAVGAVVTITYDTVGVAGNAKAISTNDATNLTLSGATLAGGIDHGTVTVNATVLVQGTDFTAETDEDTTATNIAAAIDLIAGYTSTATTATVSILVDAAGTAGNVALETNKPSDLTLSGATLAGGLAATYTDAFEVYNDKEGFDFIDYVATISAVTANGVTITPQVSYDKGTWIDRTALTEITANGSVEDTISTPKAFVRWKIVLSGAPLTVQIQAATQRGERLATPRQGNKDVAVAGTAVALSATPIFAKKVYISMKSTNVGKVFVGGVAVDEDNGAYFYATTTIEFKNVNLAEIYIDCESGNTDGVQYTYLS